MPPVSRFVMSRRLGRQSLAIFAALVSAVALYCASLPATAQHHLLAAIFDSDPNHIWNRTHRCLFVRQSADGTDYGADALDPRLWPSTQCLLTGIRIVVLSPVWRNFCAAMP